MPTKPGSAFAPSEFIFQANAVAVSLRIRRPIDMAHTQGSSSVTGGGGKASAEGQGFPMPDGLERLLSVDSYRTEVSGDFQDLDAARRLTESNDNSVSPWRTNMLPTVTSTECMVKGYQSANFDPGNKRDAGKTVRFGLIDFKMTSRHSRKSKDQLVHNFDRLAFDDVSVNGRQLKVSVRSDVFDKFPTYDSFRNEFNRSAAFRREIGPMVYRPPAKAVKCPADELFDRRGYFLVTVVNKIEWADPKGADPAIQIIGHTVLVPGYGTLYLGEMTIMPFQRRLHMVRAALGSPFGGDSNSATGCPGGHNIP